MEKGIQEEKSSDSFTFFQQTRLLRKTCSAMPTLYLPSLAPLTTAALRQTSRVEDTEGYADLPPPLQRALAFCWQWLQGRTSFLVPTSGSTGPPKTIELTRQQMVTSVRNTQRALSLTSDQTTLLGLDPAYIGGMMALCRALEIGMDVVGIPPSTHPLEELPVQPTFLAMVPLQLQSWLESDLATLNAAHAILVGGAPVSPDVEKRIVANINTPIYSTYGMTETASHVALRALNGPDAHDTFRVLGDTVIGSDARGCLTLRGSVTQQKLVVTNDQVALVDERHFRWLGRHDWVINSGGVKVSPEPVEQAVAMQWPATPPPLLVVGLPDERLGQRVVLVVEGPAPAKSDQQPLLRAVAKKVPRYHAPREIYYVAVIPRTPTGKLSRRETVAMLLRTTS